MSEKTPYERKLRDDVKKFVDDVYDRMQNDHGFRARFRRALSPSQAPQVWGDLVSAHVDIRDDASRRAFTLIGASIALEGNAEPGTLGLGEALRECGPSEKALEISDSQSARLRRLLRCSSCEELCTALRPILSLIRSRRPGALDYARLLDELKGFDFDYAQERIKARWVSDFYRHQDEEEKK